ncbi:hypothetical protein GpartN1_g6596.t1 [Galdieria partita]|uniref:Peptide deformylase n=1 Tax=Galdieria partita TaxID=83374 RepID=A0A9C7Q2Q3_9RHOD|nr:hypothetical protein GpartN1_g6596.t1 [Galdieria partita]
MAFLIAANQVMIGPSCYVRNGTGLNVLPGNSCMMSNGKFSGKPILCGRKKKLLVPPCLRPKRPSFQQLHREVSLVEVSGEDYVSNQVNMSGLVDLPKTLEVLKYPDPRLRNENAQVDPCHPTVGEIARKMFQVMYADKGVGLAAPQVGINQRLMVYNPTGKQSSFLSQVVMVNPKIVDCSDKRVIDLEGCLSFPGIAGKVSRHEWVRVEAFKPGGKKIKLKLEGWQARIFQHEYDHLDGILFIDRMEPEERARAQVVLDQLVNNYKGEGIPAL